MLKSPQNTNGRPISGELHEPAIERREKAELGFLARGARGARRKIRADDGDAAETRLDVAPFAIELGLADAAHDLDGLGARVDRNAAVTRFLGVHADAVIAARVKRALRDLLVARLELLHAEHVGALPSEPREEALARCTAQAVRVEGDDSQENRPVGTREAI